MDGSTKQSPKRLFHKLHSFILSRDVAEHLDLDSQAIIDLMNESHKWFLENNLGSPSLICATRLGFRLCQIQRFKGHPFEQVETTRGIYNAKKDKAS